MTATLAVIIPCHNLARLLPQTLAALQRATGDGIELLLVDDASTDNTPELIGAALPRLGNARLLGLERNVGLSAARNHGLAAADADWVTFLDGDDLVAPHYFPALRDACVRLGADFLRTDHLDVTGPKRNLVRVPSGARLGRVVNAREQILPADQRTSVDHPYAWAGAYRRELAVAGLLGFDEDLRTAEDRPWIWRLHLSGATMSVPDLVGLGYRRQVAGSLSQRATATQLDFVPAMARVIELVRADPDADRFLPKAIRRQCELTLHHLGLLNRFRPEVRRTFTAALADGLRTLPAAPRDAVLAELTPDRRGRLQRLMGAHAPRVERRTTR
ncbi:glycosyltransferase family 2 protein [Naumannella sp. ID2617S]|nr:glycosyltransferase family 2 protein [Naumannella sp. ID2617S]